jgi:SAM-dependent methyltransferase
VLDVGCGDGHFAGACLVPSYGARIDVGIDPAFASVREAHDAGVYRMALACGGQALPFADGSFPTVVSNCVLEHIPPLDETLREIHRVLAPGGKLIITVPSDKFAGSLFWSRSLSTLDSHRPVKPMVGGSTGSRFISTRTIVTVGKVAFMMLDSRSRSGRPICFRM